MAYPYRRMVGKRYGPHQLIRFESTVQVSAYGDSTQERIVDNYECACKGFKTDYHYRVTLSVARTEWLEHVLEDVVEKVYNYKPPRCNCMNLIGFGGGGGYSYPIPKY